MKTRITAISSAVAGLGALGIATYILQPFEGREYRAYQDPVGIWSICDGATTGVVKGDFADDLDCDRMTARDVAEADATFERCAPGLRHEMPPYRRAAFLDFIYNVGPGGTGIKDGFCRLRNGREPRMLWLLKRGHQIAACNEFPFWNKQKLKGIAERREVERLVCLGLIVEGAGWWHNWRRR
jgi:lysozyme